MKVYITKYALTDGILQMEVLDCGDGMVKSLDTNYSVYFHNEGQDWHKTEESAIERAEKMRNNRINSLEKQIEKLKKLNFK